MRRARRCTSGAGGEAGDAFNDPRPIPPRSARRRRQQQADALALLAETALHHELDPGAPGERYQVVVHVDAPALADPDQPGQSVLEDGAHVSAETSRRLACDASRVVMRHDEDGRVVEVGARTRTIPPALRRALHHRDRGCRFPGCGLPLRRRAITCATGRKGGPTTLSNLALLCRRHHRAVHEEGYQVDREPDGALQFRRPDGRLLPEVPPPAAVPADPVQASPRAARRAGAPPPRADDMPGWLGERLDVGYAIDVLHPLARRPADRHSAREDRPRRGDRLQGSGNTSECPRGPGESCGASRCITATERGRAVQVHVNTGADGPRPGSLVVLYRTTQPDIAAQDTERSASPDT